MRRGNFFDALGERLRFGMPGRREIVTLVIRVGMADDVESHRLGEYRRSTMKAWLLKDQKGLGSMKIGDAFEPHAVAGEAVVELFYAALNPADRYLAEGMYPGRLTLPHILGRDGVGKVIEVGPGIAGAKKGDAVMILRGETGVSRPGTLAEKVAVAVDNLVPIPPDWSIEEAACGTLVYLTAYQALTDWPDLPPKSRVLITGASGGVGVASIQLARAMGHEPI